MPLIKPRTHRVRIVRHICRLQEPNRDALVRYASFIGDTPDYVLNRLLETTLVKDKDFVAWQAEQTAQDTRTAAKDTPSSERRGGSVPATAPSPVAATVSPSATSASVARPSGGPTVGQR